MRVRLLFCCLVALALMPAVAGAAEKFVPQGHSYSPEQDRLPYLNSGRDRVNSQADIYESEIYRVQRERAIFEAELMRHMQHEFSSGAEFSPRY